MDTQKTGHWVEDLFPPTFGYTVEELQQSQTVAEEETDKAADPRSMFDHVAANTISTLDVSTIRNVYERVWLMEVLEEEERKMREKEPSKETEDKKQTDVVKDRKKDDALISKDDSKESVDIHDSCIWSSKEIDVLRHVFKAAKHQNTELRAQLMAANDKIKKLESQSQSKNKALDTRTKNLSEALKANKRLQILSQNLKSQLDASVEQADNLRQDLERLETERDQHLKEMHQLRLQLDKERLEKTRVEITLKNKHKDSLQQEILHTENLKALHEQDVAYLQKKISELSDEIKAEKDDHARTKRGLEHLRKHFASLPIEGATGYTKPVAKDQLTRLKYS